MTTTRAHLKEMHTAHADFHTKAAKSHLHLSKCFGKSGVEGAEDIAAAHEELAKTHAAAASYAVECCKTLDAATKAMGDNDGNRAMPLPEGLSNVYKSDHSVVKAIPRNGAPEMVDTSGVDPALRKLVEVEDDS